MLAPETHETDLPQNPRERIGGNFPPETITEIVGALPAKLAEDFGPFAQQVDALAKRAYDWLPKSKDRPEFKGMVISGTADVEKVKQIVFDAKKTAKAVETLHAEEKKPFLDAGRMVDAQKNALDTKITSMIAAMDRLLIAYRKKLEDEAAALAEIEARKNREEAVRQAEIARKAEEEGRAAAAIKAQQRADNAAEDARRADAAAATVAQDIKKDSAFSGMSTRTETRATITDKEKIDLNLLHPWITADMVEKALKGWVKANGDKPLDGVTFSKVPVNSYRGR